MVILFFDGECGLCNRAVVRFLQWENGDCRVHFAPLQGDTARKQLTPEQAEPPFSSLLVWDGQALHERASGLRVLAKELRFPWRNLAMLGLRIIPVGWLNAGYDMVARHRYRASKFSCAVHADAKSRRRFLP
jgi:predicted DCC family thiol-disulfide oxidoreductase YuxK